MRVLLGVLIGGLAGSLLAGCGMGAANELQVLGDDGGRYVGFVRMVARMKTE